MAAFTTFNAFTEHLMEGVHDLDLDTLRAYLTDNTPDQANNTVKADLVESVAGINGYTAGGHDIQGSTARVLQVTDLDAIDVVITAAGGSIGPFRYVVIYNDTPVAPADPLIGYLDYGGSITVDNGQTFTIDFGTFLGQLTF